MTTSVTVKVAFAGKRLPIATSRDERRPDGRDDAGAHAGAGSPSCSTKPTSRGRVNRARVRPPAPCSRATADRLARQLALAHLVERMIDAGEIATFAEAARRLGVTTSRLSQVMDLLGLAAAMQEEILTLTMCASERALR